jgi:hypothetical protein
MTKKKSKSDSSAKTPRKKVGLPRAIAFKIGAHLAENWEAIERERPSYEEYAQRMAKSFQCVCTPWHIQSLVRDIGKTWPNRKKEAVVAGDLALLARVESLEQQVQILMSRAFGPSVTVPSNGYIHNGSN